MGAPAVDGFSYATWAVVFCILLVIILASSVVFKNVLRPRSKFATLIGSVLVTGLFAGLFLEWMDIHLLEGPAMPDRDG